jgi:hypothetical protein
MTDNKLILYFYAVFLVLSQTESVVENLYKEQGSGRNYCYATNIMLHPRGVCDIYFAPVLRHLY